MSYSDKQHIDWLIDKLNMDDNSFRHSNIYKVLKDQLTIKGYWKAKQRGKPDVNNFAGKQAD